MTRGKSLTLKAVIFLVLIAAVFFAAYKYNGNTVTIVNTENKENKKEETAPISITQQDIKGENFSGSVAHVSGSGALPLEAQKYIDQTISDFKKQADIDVPSIKAEFGADSPTASYSIDISAKYVQGEKTESLAISIYSYTGGAHGNSVYKVITTSKGVGKILQLSDIIKEDKETAFTEFVKKELNAWAPSGSTAPVVFPEEVANLKFESFQNWSLDEENLILYFSQYEIGPGVLGPVAFPMSLSSIKDFLK